MFGDWWKRLRRLAAGGVRQRVTRSGLVFTLMVVMVGIAAFVSANNLLFLLFAVMLAALMVSGLASRLTLAELEVDVSLPEHIAARQKAAAQVRVHNRKWFAAFSVRLSGVRHEYQKFNNCGPANLSMALSFWGWQGDQRDTAAFLKPSPADKNVMPYEMANFVAEQTGLRLLVRAGGDLDMVRRLVAAGFPPILELGYEPPKKDWMGHYELVTGYDDQRQRLIVQDSYIMPDLPVPYAEVQQYWQHFNYTYLILYPPEREAEVLALLGPMADEEANTRHALAIADLEIQQSQGRKLYFAWFNRGTNLVRLQDYLSAAQAYDQAFAIYNSLDPTERPWRNLWYQTGPYFAYFYTGRYYDVINLASNILNNMDQPIHEESLYWRALAKEALGDRDGAIVDLRASLEAHPGFRPSLAQLERMGVQP